MNAILLTAKAKDCDLILSRKKTVGVLKSTPNIETPFKVYLYCQKDTENTFQFIDGKRDFGKVVCEIICDRSKVSTTVLSDEAKACCMTAEDLSNNGKPIYFYHIARIFPYNTPKTLKEFHLCKDGKTVSKAPQSFCYVEELK